jgi:hypothetical protein
MVPVHRSLGPNGTESVDEMLPNCVHSPWSFGHQSEHNREPDMKNTDKPNKIASKGTSWRRRGAGIIAGVALTVTAGLGAGIAGSADAAPKSGPAVTTQSTGGGYSTSANAGWGG